MIARDLPLEPAKILAATDFSRPAQQAVQRAVLLAKQTGAQLRIVHALPDEKLIDRLLKRHDIQHDHMVRGTERALQTLCAEIERSHAVTPTWAIAIGPAHRAVLDAASTFDADLLVAGAQGEGEPSGKEPSLGGTALKLLARSDTPLLLVRRRPEESYGTMLIAVESGERARHTVPVARALARGADCYLLHVFEAPFAQRLRGLEVSQAAIDVYAQDQHAEHDRELQALIDDCGLNGHAFPAVVRGSPAAAILHEVKRLQPDLLVMGKHDDRKRESAELGSVSLRVASSIRCDLLQSP